MATPGVTGAVSFAPTAAGTAAGGGGSTQGPASDNQNSAIETPQSWEQPFQGDARKGQGTGEYPNQWVHKTRSGHNFIMDDSKGHETVTIQHRSGTAIQMDPDGALHITAHNSRYDIVFGEHRMTISGAQDITVKGDASLRVYGDLNTTVHKNYNLTVNGDFNVTAKNFNRHIRGNMDTMAKNESKKFEGSSGVQAGGSISRVAKSSVTMASQEDQLHAVGATGVNVKVPVKGNVNVYSEEGDLNTQTKKGKWDASFDGGGQNEKVTMVAEKGNFTHQSDKEVNVKSKTSNITTNAKQDITTTSEAGNIKHEAAAGGVTTSAAQDIQSSAGQNHQIKAGQNAQVTAGSEASLDAMTTHVSGMVTNIKGSAVTNVDGSSMLNLNGGMAQVMNMLNIKMPFNLGNFQDAQGVKGIKAERADQPQEEPDSKSFWDTIH